jgi:hypothetical protein
MPTTGKNEASHGVFVDAVTRHSFVLSHFEVIHALPP